MLYCAYCDTKILEDDRHCEGCAAPVKKAKEMVVKKDNFQTESISDIWSTPTRTSPESWNHGDFTVRSGDDYSLNFEITEEDDDETPIDCSAAVWELTPLGCPEKIILSLPIGMDGAVALLPEMTSGLTGRFVHRVIFQNPEGHIYVFHEGFMTFLD